MTPRVTVVNPDSEWAHSPEEFCKKECFSLIPSSRLQFIGLDDDVWRIQDMCIWVKNVSNIFSSEDPKRIFLTSIVIMVWPEKLIPTGVKSMERFRDIVLAGADLRIKRERYYSRDGSQFLESFERDLQDSGLLLTLDERDRLEPYPAPEFDTDEDKENYRQRLEFYANPPFKWDPDDLAALFGSKSSSS